MPPVRAPQPPVSGESTLKMSPRRRRLRWSVPPAGIGSTTRCLRTFDTAAGERLARFLEDEALRLDR